MKGSDKWGQGGGPRIRVELILVVLLAISLVGVYFFVTEQRGLIGSTVGGITTVSTTGIGCDSSSMPQAAQLVQNDSRFVVLSGNVCYNYMGENASGDATVLYFDYFNGTILYPCGTSPEDVVTSQIQAEVSSSGEVQSVQAVNGTTTAISSVESCSSVPPAVGVVSVSDDESTIPAVPQLNVTMEASAAQPAVSSLTVTLTLDGGSQKFVLVTPPTTLAPGSAISKSEIILSDLSFNADELYPMNVSGTFVGGQTFDYQVQVQIAQIP